MPDWPLTIVLGETVIPLRAGAGGLTVSTNVLLTPESEAVNVTGVATLTLPAVTEKVAEVEPFATVTIAGMLTTEEDEPSAIVAPPL
jgi:hypothetical protein